MPRRSGENAAGKSTTGRAASARRRAGSRAPIPIASRPWCAAGVRALDRVMRRYATQKAAIAIFSARPQARAPFRQYLRGGCTAGRATRPAIFLKPPNVAFFARTLAARYAEQPPRVDAA